MKINMQVSRFVLQIQKDKVLDFELNMDMEMDISTSE
jgi:hypothetical protein